MTTHRNNLFFYRGACGAYSAILKILEETKDEKERHDMLEKLHTLWIKGAIDLARHKPDISIDSATVFTEKIYITIEDGKYKVVEQKLDEKCFYKMIFWNSKTKTNYIINFTGDFDLITDFIDCDENFKDNICKLISCNYDEIEEKDAPMVIYLIEEKGALYD